jgi:hypothetical protein
MSMPEQDGAAAFGIARNHGREYHNNRVAAEITIYACEDPK